MAAGPIYLSSTQKAFLRQYTFDYKLAVIFDNLDGLFNDTIFPAWVSEFSPVSTDPEEAWNQRVLMKVRDRFQSLSPFRLVFPYIRFSGAISGGSNGLGRLESNRARWIVCNVSSQ